MPAAFSNDGMFTHQHNSPIMDQSMPNCHCRSWKAHNGHSIGHDRMTIPDNLLEGNFRRDNGRVDSHGTSMNMSVPQSSPFPQQTTAASMDYDNILFGNGHNPATHSHWKNGASMEVDSMGSTTAANRDLRTPPTSFAGWPEQVPMIPQK